MTSAQNSQVIGEVTELFVDNIDQHPYHHHIQPYQIVALGNDSDARNAWWRVRSTPFLSELGCAGRHTQNLLLPDLTALHCMPVMPRCRVCNSLDPMPNVRGQFCELPRDVGG